MTLDRLAALASRLENETADCGFDELREAARVLPALVPLPREWTDSRAALVDSGGEGLQQRYAKACEALLAGLHVQLKDG